jgi:hypothetical protein
MRTFFTLTLLALSTTFSSAQLFEGEIVYENTYKSKNPRFSDQQYQEMIGNKQTYLMKDGNYKSSMNGKFMEWQLYRNQDNKLYQKMVNAEVAVWNDAALNTDSVLSLEVNRNVVEILGYKCDELVLNCTSGTQKYYYSRKLALDAKLFENHKYGNWYSFLEKAKALPLKIVIDNPELTLTSTAISVEPMELSKSDFELPEKMATTKNSN